MNAPKEVLLLIRGIQQGDDGQDEITELTTTGMLWWEEDTLCLSYVESEMTGMEGVKTIFRAEDGKITMTREGAVQSTMTFVEGERHESLYDLGIAAMLLRVSAKRVRTRIGEKSGKLEFWYNVELERRLVATHRYEVEYRQLTKKR